MTSTTAEAAPAVSQSQLFSRLRWQLLRNSLAVILGGSWLRMATILMCRSIVWAVVYATSTHGFAFLAEQNIFLAGGIVGTRFDLLVLVLLVLLIGSSGTIISSRPSGAPGARSTVASAAW